MCEDEEMDEGQEETAMMAINVLGRLIDMDVGHILNIDFADSTILVRKVANAKIKENNSKSNTEPEKMKMTWLYHDNKQPLTVSS